MFQYMNDNFGSDDSERHSNLKLNKNSTRKVITPTKRWNMIRSKSFGSFLFLYWHKNCNILQIQK